MLCIKTKYQHYCSHTHRATAAVQLYAEQNCGNLQLGQNIAFVLMHSSIHHSIAIAIIYVWFSPLEKGPLHMHTKFRCFLLHDSFNGAKYTSVPFTCFHCLLFILPRACVFHVTAKNWYSQLVINYCGFLSHRCQGDDDVLGCQVAQSRRVFAKNLWNFGHRNAIDNMTDGVRTSTVHVQVVCSFCQNIF